MVSLDVGSDQGEDPRIYECEHCRTTLVASQPPDELTCCGEEMVPVGEEARALGQPDLNRLLGEVFGLSRATILVCIYVIERGPTTISDAAEELGLGESTVSDSLNHLDEAGIVRRSQRNLTGGGTVYVYSAVPFEEQQRIYRLGLYRWITEAIQLIDEFDLDDLKEEYRQDGTDRNEEEPGIYWN